MNNLTELIIKLKAFTIIFIENAFIYEENAEKILAKFCLLPNKNRHKITQTLSNEGNKFFAQSLVNFYTSFNSKDRNKNLELELPATEYFKHYLAEINAVDLGEDGIINDINGLLSIDVEDKFKDLLLKHGIYSSVYEAGYDELIQSISQLDEVSILIYKSQPTEDDIENFFEEIDNTRNETESEFCLAIIDKKLATGVAENEGKSFIKNSIVPKNEKESTKIICCLYTSQPENNLPLESFSDYFIQEIGKDSPDKFEQITKTLTRSAYAQVFNTIKIQYQNSAENALSMVLKNQKNIKYIIEHSIKEGISGIEAIKYWFNTAQQYQFDIEEIKALRFFAGIVNFFDNKYLEDHPHIGKIGPELKELNSFELFDQNINKKYLPIAPGDIWQINDEYYILMGQLCDILLRSDNKRNAKFGELLKLEITERPSSTHKYSIEVKSGRRLITVQNFPTQDKNYKSIVIDVSTNTTEFAELEALDLVMFSSNGDAKISLDEKNEIDALKILPKNMSSYYEKLKSKIILKAELMAQIDISVLNSNIKFSDFNLAKNNNHIDLKFKRIARLKGRYYDSVYNNFLNNKGRIDLNLIDNAPEHVSVVNLKCCFVHDQESVCLINNVNLWTALGKLYFKRDELIALLPNEFKAILQYANNLLELGPHNQYDLVKVDDENFSFEFKYMISQDSFQARSTYSYKVLFGQEKPSNNPNFQVYGEKESSFLNENGYATNTLSVDQLKKGVLVFDKKTKLQFVNGILIRTEIEEQD